MALELCILTAARSGAIYGARWDEIDLENRVWTVPATRMKAGREYRIPSPVQPWPIWREPARQKRSTPFSLGGAAVP